MTAEAPPATPKTKQTTEYVVLRERLNGAPSTASSGTPPDVTYSIVKTLNATSGHDAIKQAAGEDPGTYRAIPARSWKPVKVTVHTETTVRLG